MQTDKMNNYFFGFKKTFTERFYRQIRLKLYGIVRAANAELITLFWETGKILDITFAGEVNASTRNTRVKKIANDLSVQYGEYFNEKNLQQMLLFFRKFPDRKTIDHIKCTMSWEHILVLLEIETDQLRDFYLQYSIQHTVGPGELKTIIAGKVHQQSPAGKANQPNQQTRKPHSARTVMEQMISNEKGWVNPFRPPVLAAFRMLTELPITKKTIPAQNAAGNKPADPYHQIDKLVHAYREKQNRLLNSHINLAFFELGREVLIENELGVDEQPDIKILIRQTVNELNKKFGITFTQGQLQEMVRFAALCRKDRLLTVVADFLTWKQILVLLPFNSTALINYYVNKLAIKQMSLPTFRKLVKNEAEKVLAGFAENDKTDYPFPLLVTVTRLSQQKKNKTTAITYIDFAERSGKQLINPRVFEDSQLMRFLSVY